MQMYLILELVIIGALLLASWERKTYFIQYFPQALISIILIGFVYIIWNIVAIERSHWSFQDAQIENYRFMGIPAETLIYFWVVPYAGLFILNAVRYNRRHQEDELPFSNGRIGGMIALTGLILWFGKGYEYTGLSCLSAGLFFLADMGLKKRTCHRVSFWYTQVLLALFILLFHGYLTSQSVIIYGEKYLTGLRIFTIPIEDFIYAFSLSAWTMLIFNLLIQRKEKDKTDISV